MLRPLIIATALGLALLAMTSMADAAGGEEATTVSALGIARAGGEEVFVEVLVAVPGGTDGHAAAAQALREQGARPADRKELESAGFTTSGLVWDVFSDGAAGNDFVVQNYNPKGDPTTGGAGLAALLNTHATWNNVATSSFTFSYGGTTNRCPSLVNECPGPQTFDNKNDVGWMKLSGSSTLAVTWFSTSRDEADMGINTRFKWSTSVPTPAGRYDLESVILHENGHAAGLGHSADPNAVMYAYYGGLRRALHQDDIDGISFLYP